MVRVNSKSKAVMTLMKRFKQVIVVLDLYSYCCFILTFLERVCGASEAENAIEARWWQRH